MSKRHGLGKGLSALIPEEDYSISDKKIINKVSINLIKANSKQPRKYFDEDKLLKLADSIREHGIIQPIILKQQDKNYIVIAGERRWRAAKSIGLKEIPAIIMEDVDDLNVLELSLIENIQREDLNPIEEANAYKKLLEDFNLTQDELSKKIGKSRTAITNCIRLLNLDERVQEYLMEGVITEGHGRALLGIYNNDIQYEIAQKIIDEALSVREVEKIVKNLNSEKVIKKQEKIENPFYVEIKNKLEDYFGTKVVLNNKKNNKGKIEIEYYSEDDLQRILDILKI
ncbi:putative chromosome-partitioning protein ParB [Clostridium tepidiprofundi DSM 19306]|uniref:Putative chromosome-partitioning protein ParB n=1 Tax=Clostridium tepidiprofundi DSM 19306 TaxID=1121338 RepID=A0A151B2Y2_9CLOT|nr:ParB/RepB/Spo0J family partition protein [Clostridium tepidiprofundi]KYH34112.1 putative chromosome-partitioning protein ParB [Clostridium tepidiprofundi DSM 19306]